MCRTNLVVRGLAVLAVVLFATAPLSADVSTVVALKFPACRVVPDTVTIVINGQPIDAIKTVINKQPYWIATDVPSYEVETKRIEVKAGGVPLFCGAGARPVTLQGYSDVGLFTISYEEPWLLEVSSNPPAAFKYVRGECTPSENPARTSTQLLDVGRKETIKVGLRGTDDQPMATIELTHKKIAERRGTWRLSGAEMVRGDVFPAIEGTKNARAYDRKYSDAELGGLREVLFRFHVK